jgi:tetraacyldisaccharide 4'-kinase
MLLNKPSFWDKKKSFASYVLFPISLIVLLVNFLKRNFTKIKKFNIPVICVGNIYLGGTGKTPASILIARELNQLKRNPVILKKFYRTHKDEHELIKSNFKNLILCPKRVEGIQAAEREKYDSVILDDGFQDHKIKKDLNIICFNQEQLLGNGMILPAGPLRESLKALEHAHVILINGEKNNIFEDRLLKINENLKFFYSYYKPIDVDNFKNKRFFALAGIGNPENFFKLLNKNNLKIEKKISFPDHYRFSKKIIFNIIEEAEKNNCEIIMTEKDFFKIKDFKLKNINYLKVSLEIERKDSLIRILNKLYDKNY